jgi:hypothetical protein
MSEILQGQIDQLQQDAVDRLTSHAELAGIDVFFEKTKDVASAIEIAVGKTKGICIVVTPPTCRNSRPNLPGPYMDETILEVNAVESPIINESAAGTKKSASYVAELCAKRLHHFVTRDSRCLIVLEIVPVPDPQYRVYRARIRTAFGLHD